MVAEDYGIESASFSVERVCRANDISNNQQKDDYLDQLIDLNMAGLDTKQVSNALEKLNLHRRSQRKAIHTEGELSRFHSSLEQHGRSNFEWSDDLID